MATVIVPVYGRLEMAASALNAIRRTTRSEDTILAIDDATPATEGDLGQVLDSMGLLDAVTVIKHPRNLGFVGAVNTGLEVATQLPGPVAIVNSDVTVFEGWLSRMEAALDELPRAATITAMATKGGIATVRLGSETLEGQSDQELASLNSKLGVAPALNHADIPTGVGHCMLIRKAAIAQVGRFSDEFAPGYGEEVDFCLRASKYGYTHLLAWNVVVRHEGGATFGSAREKLQQHGDELLNRKYPGYNDYIATFLDRATGLETLFLNVLVQSRGMRVLIDGRSATAGQTGSHLVMEQVARELAQSDRVTSVHVVVHDDAARKRVSISGVKTLATSDIWQHVSERGKYDIVFRPGQLSDMPTFEALWGWAYRVAVLHLDYISYTNWAYHPSVASLREYQDANRFAGLAADALMFNSACVRRESAVLLGSSSRLHQFVMGNGVDHLILDTPAAPKARRSATEGSPKHVVLLGAAFHHKNRGYAIRLIEMLNDVCQEPISLTLVGPRPSIGDSTPEDEEYASESGAFVNFLPWLPAADLERLMDDVDLCLYPSLVEGFGLVPFEMAARSVPTLFGSQAGLISSLGVAPFMLSLESIEDDARLVCTVLSSRSAQVQQVEYIRMRAQRWVWSEVCRDLVDAFFEAVRQAPRMDPLMRGHVFEAYRSRVTLSLRLQRHAVLWFPMSTRRRRLALKVWRRLKRMGVVA